MNLDSEQRRWEALAAHDTFWTILGRNEETGSPWTPEEFFQTGRNDVARVRSVMEQYGGLPGGGRALDFGCGIGRLSQALCEVFAEVTGVDISAMMVEQAERLNRFPERCRYVVSAEQDLGMFASGSVDFVISRLVLQHLSRPLATRYLREFVRVLAPGGLLVVQVPASRIRHKARYVLDSLFRGALSAALTIAKRRPRIAMNVIPEAAVREVLREGGGRVIHVESDPGAGAEFESLVYYAVRDV